MTPDLRAIEAALLGEPHTPSNLSPEAASVVLSLVRRVVQERDELREALEEARLTLAAEQGRTEGAPSGWEWTGGMWRRNGYPHAVTARHYGPTHLEQPWQWEVWDTRPALDVRLIGKGYSPTARAAMIAADAAVTPR